MSTSLSAATVDHIEALFPPELREQVRELLSRQCGSNLSFCENRDEFQLERVRFAALKLSKGNLRELQKAVKLAQTDWRDVLMAAGFAHDLNAHKKWSPGK